jgi:predicted exporter
VVGCIALGLAVDDTAHVLGHLRAGYPLAAIYRLVARPMLLTTLCLGLGFSALMLSGFEPIWALGAATSVTLGVAFLCDWLVLPSMLRILDAPLFADAETDEVSQERGGAQVGLPGFSGLEPDGEGAGRPKRRARHAA